MLPTVVFLAGGEASWSFSVHTHGHGHEYDAAPAEEILYRSRLVSLNKKLTKRDSRNARWGGNA